MLGSTVFNVLINNLEADVNIEIKSLEDTKLFRIERREDELFYIRTSRTYRSISSFTYIYI